MILDENPFTRLIPKDSPNINTNSNTIAPTPTAPTTNIDSAPKSTLPTRGTNRGGGFQGGGDGVFQPPRESDYKTVSPDVANQIGLDDDRTTNTVSPDVANQIGLDDDRFNPGWGGRDPNDRGTYTPGTPKSTTGGTAQPQNPNSDDSGDGGGYTGDQSQPGASGSNRSFPSSNGGGGSDDIWGLPPVACTGDEHLSTIFPRSFPLLKIRPVKIQRAENSGQITNVSPIADYYKFAVKNDGAVVYTLNNEYGSSMLEDEFKNATYTDLIHQGHQIFKTSRILNQAISGATDMAMNAFSGGNK